MSMTTSNNFEDRLLAELRHVVAERSAPGVLRTTTRPPRARIALTGAGLAAATAVVAIVASGSDVTPAAFAVQSRPDGSVAVEVHSLSDSAGLQRSLRAAGLPAVVRYASGAACVRPDAAAAGSGTGVQPATRGEMGTQQAPQGAGEGPSFSTGGRKAAGDGQAAAVPGEGNQGKVTSSVTATGDGVKFTIDPAKVKPGERVFITTSSGAVDSLGITIARAADDAGCVPPPPGG
jgi:hypothetical protein